LSLTPDEIRTISRLGAELKDATREIERLAGDDKDRPD